MCDEEKKRLEEMIKVDLQEKQVENVEAMCRAMIDKISSFKKSDIIDFLNTYSFSSRELECIYDFIFYLYTGDFAIFYRYNKNYLWNNKN